MIEKELSGEKILIVGGAGFVGSNLSHYILSNCDPECIWIVDNLLSSDICNVPDDPRIKFLFGSITENKILNTLPKDLSIVFHLACYHGNQSSIADPLADHDNNTLTTLKLFNHIKDYKKLQKVVYAAAGCAVAEKTFDDPKATYEDAPVSLFHDSPYSISKLIGEMYGNYYFQSYGLPFVKARFQNVYGPREILGAGRWRGTPHTVWRNVVPTFIWKSIQREALPLDNGGNASRDFIFVEDVVKVMLLSMSKVQDKRTGKKPVPGEKEYLDKIEKAGEKSVVELIPKEFRQSPTRFMSHVLDTGVMPSGTTSQEQLDNWKSDKEKPSYDARNTLVQSIMRYNQLFTVKTEITIAGDFSIKAGDVIQCDFSELKGTEQGDSVNTESKGLYMVASVCHKITPREVFSSLSLVRDSFGGNK